MKHALSLGAGVQSSTMALMAAKGEIGPMPDCAVFADTQAEPYKVYEWLAWLEKQLPFPVYRVTTGNLEKDTLQSNYRPRIANPPFYTAPVKFHERGKNGFALTAPFYTKAEPGTAVVVVAKPEDPNVPALFSAAELPVDGAVAPPTREGQLRRQCTREYKIEPMNKFLRQWVGLQPRQRSKEIMVTRWIGISLDESHRAKLSTEPWATNRHPLLELGMSRADCLNWMERNGYPKPAKSACYFCPYHDDAMWRDMKENEPEEFERAVVFDEAIRHGTVKGVTAPVYLHRSCVPIAEVDFRNAEDAGQSRMFDENGFAVECEGLCGL